MTTLKCAARLADRMLVACSKRLRWSNQALPENFEEHFSTLMMLMSLREVDVVW
jgi:hypothetical protein